MPLYSDLGMYYAPHLTTPSYYSSPFLGSSRSAGTLGLGLLPVPRLLPTRVTPSYSPLLPSIPESSGYGVSRLGLPSLDRATSPRVGPRYLPPKPVHIDTADIDVSATRLRRERPDIPTGPDPSRQPTIKRGRTVVRLHTKKLKENPQLDARRRMTPGEKLMQKFLILDKREEEEKAARRKRLEELEERERVEAEVTRLQAMAAKKAAADEEAGGAAPDGTFAPDETSQSAQNFPSIQGLTENAALDILLSATDEDEERAQGGEIARTESTGTVKKRKAKEKDGTVKAAKKKAKKKDALDRSQSPAEDSPATGDEMVEKSMLQRRNTIRFRRNSDVEGFPEIESIPGSRRSSFDLISASRRSSVDQSPSSRRSSVDSTGEEIPLASEKKSTVRRRKGPPNKIVTEVSVDNSPTREPRSPKFVVDEVKVEQCPDSPRGGQKKFRYEVIVEDIEEEKTSALRGKLGKENKGEVVAKKKKAKPVATKPLADRQDKAVPKTPTDVKAEKKESTPKSFQKSRPEPAEETKAQVAVSKTDEIAGTFTQQKVKVTQGVEAPKKVTQENQNDAKGNLVQNNLVETTENKLQINKIDKKVTQGAEAPKKVTQEKQNDVKGNLVQNNLVEMTENKLQVNKIDKKVTQGVETPKEVTQEKRNNVKGNLVQSNLVETSENKLQDKKVTDKKVTQGVETSKKVTQEKQNDAKCNLVQNNLVGTTENKFQDNKIDKKDKWKLLSNEKKPLEDLKIPKSGPKDIQNGLFVTEKAKPSVLAEIPPKLEEAKVGKQVVEKTKVIKHQADPSPGSGTPTSEMQDSGINFWAFLNGVEEEKEPKKPLFAKKEPLIQPQVDKIDKTKKAKTKPVLQLKIQNKCAPAENIPKLDEKDNRANKSATPSSKTNEVNVKTVEEKKEVLPHKPEDITKELQSSPLKQSIESETCLISKLKSDETDSITSKLPTESDKTRAPKKDELSAKTPEEKVLKWKAPAKDRTKTPETPGTTGSAGKFILSDKECAADLASSTSGAEEGKFKEKISSGKDSFLSDAPNDRAKSPKKEDTVKDATPAIASSKIGVQSDGSKTKELKKETQETTVAVSKLPETPETKPPPKWKGLGKQPASPKEPKTSDALQQKKAEVNLKWKIPQKSPETTMKTDDLSPKVISPATDTSPVGAIPTSEKTPTAASVALETPKITNESQEKTKASDSPQKQSPTDEEPPKKILLKKQDSKEGKSAGKVSTPDQDSKPVPKWKIKAAADKDAGLKKTPAQVSADKSATISTTLKATSEMTSPLEQSKGMLPEAAQLTKVEKKSSDDAAKAMKTNSEEAVKITEPKTPTDGEKPAKKPLGKKGATKPSETSPVSAQEEKITQKVHEEKQQDRKTADETKLKRVGGKEEEKIAVDKLKCKDEGKDDRIPFGKKGKPIKQKSQDKDEEKEVPATAKKENKQAAQKDNEENSGALVGKNKVKQSSKGTKDEKNEPTTPTKKVGKLVGQKSKDEDKSEALPKKGAKLPAQKSKEESSDPTSPVKKGAKNITQKSNDKSEPPVKKSNQLVTEKNKENEKKEPPSPAKKDAELAPKIKENEKKEPPSPAKKGVKLVAQKSKEDDKSVPKKTPPSAKKAETKEGREATGKTATTPTPTAAATLLTPPAAARAPESGSDADSEESSSSEDEGGDATPRATSSSCSSSDSGFDSRPSSVPGSPPSNKKVPSTASDASSREPGTPSPARLLACSPSLDPYSEDAGLPRSASGRTTPPAHTLPRFRKYTVDDFQFLKLLGKGSFGKVLLAELRGTDRYYAVKCLKKDVVLEDDDVECTLIERKVLALGTKHPYLCHLFCTFQTESHLLFVMEYLNGGDLMFHIQQSGRFPEPRARFYGAEIVSGLKFLHKKGIVYRDLKLDNILLDYEGHVRIADFGMCKLQIFLDRTADTFCGTPDYMAPEIIKGLKYNQCVDWWSFGVLVFEMLVGVSPFSGCDEDELFWSICNEQPQYPRFLSREAHSLLCSLLEKDALKRLGTPLSPKGDVPDHVFFRSVDWDALERRELEPPFRPRVKHPLDVQYFDAAFTAERAELTPVDASILQSMDQAQFQGFSYTNPNATD